MTYTLNKQKLLTKKQAEAVVRHLKADMSYGSGGSFVLMDRTDKDGNYLPDLKDMRLVDEAIHRIREYLTQD